MESEIEWKPVMKKGKLIGAIGFIEGKIAVVVTFFDEKDANKDGSVSLGERFAAAGGGILTPALHVLALQEVINAYAASGYVDAEEKIEIMKETKKNATKIGADLAMAALFKIYFGPGISLLGGGIARKVTSGMIKGFVVKKSFEKAVKRALKAGVEAS